MSGFRKLDMSKKIADLTSFFNPEIKNWSTRRSVVNDPLEMIHNTTREAHHDIPIQFQKQNPLAHVIVL